MTIDMPHMETASKKFAINHAMVTSIFSHDASELYVECAIFTKNS